MTFLVIFFLLSFIPVLWVNYVFKKNDTKEDIIKIRKLPQDLKMFSEIFLKNSPTN